MQPRRSHWGLAVRDYLLFAAVFVFLTFAVELLRSSARSRATPVSTYVGGLNLLEGTVPRRLRDVAAAGTG